MNFQITQGTGTTIGTDSVAAVNFQQIKLMDATLGSSSPTGIASNPFIIAGPTGALALDSSVNGLLVGQGSTTLGQFGPLIMGAVSATAPVYTTGQTSPFSLTLDGALRVLPNPTADRPATGVMAGPTDTVVFDCTGISTLGWTTSGNWIGTMTHEVQYGDGQWFTVETIDTNLANDGKPFVVTQWTQGLNNDPWITNVAGATQIRFRFVSYTSGTANIVTNGSAGVNAVRVYNLTGSILQTAVSSIVPVSDTTTTGSLVTLNSTLGFTQTGLGSCIFQLGGVWTGTVVAEGSIDNGVTWVNIPILPLGGGAQITSSGVSANGNYRFAVIAGQSQLRLRMAAYTSGTADVIMNASTIQSPHNVYQLNPANLLTSSWLSDGTGNALTSTLLSGKQALDVNIAGGVTIDVNLDHTTDNVLVYGNDGTTDRKILTDASGRTIVSVNNFPATQAVTQSTSPWVVSLASTTITGTVAVTQSGTWNLNNISGTISLPTGAATEASLAKLTLTQGSTTSGQSGTLIQGAVTTVAPTYTTAQTSPLSLTLAGALRVDGSGVTQPVSGTGNFTVVQATGTNLHTVVDSGSITVANATLAVTQSGTWTVQPGNTANTTPWLTTINQGGNSATVTGANALKVDNSAVTQPTNITQIAGNAISTAASGIINVGVTDGTGTSIGSASISGAQYLNVTVAASGTTGAAVPARTLQVGGSDGTNLQAIATDTAGRVKVDTFDGSGNALTSTVVGTTRSIDSNITQSADGYAAAQNQVYTTSFNFNLPTGGTESPAVYLKNPNASGKTLVIKRISAVGTTTANNQAVLNLYSNPTTSANGTAQTATTTSVGSGATAVATPFSGPTVTGGANGARLLSWSCNPAVNNNAPNMPVDVNGLIRVAANNNILITGTPTANNMAVNFTIIWQEV